MSRSSSPPPATGAAPTLQDIAARCGVSTATVSLALRGASRISPATTTRVLAVAEELGYDPANHLAARQLALRKHGRTALNRVIALFVPQDFHLAVYTTTIFRGIMDALQAERFGLLVVYAMDEGELLSIISSGNIDAAISILPFDVERVVAALRAAPHFGARPVVSIFAEVAGVSTVHADVEAGAYLATRHLLDLGHRFIMQIFTGWGEVANEQRRIAGVRRAMREYGLDPDRHHVLRQIGEFPLLDPALPPAQAQQFPIFRTDAGQSPRVYLQAHPEITAFLAANDGCAIHLWRWLQAEGLRVPEDYSIIGFDDTEVVLDAEGHNLLTSVHQPLAEMGQAAGALAVRRVLRALTEEQHLLLPTTLTVRHSTAPPARTP
jgi:LacI family transcriptional regulator